MASTGRLRRRSFPDLVVRPTLAQNLGLTDKQLDYALRLVAVVHQRGLPIKVGYIVLATVLTESGLKMYANQVNAESLTLPHDAVGADHDSVGLFQQRPNWGTTAQRMNVEVSCGLFLDRLVGTNWIINDDWVAAQDVQVSAYDGHPRMANHFSSVYGGNYLAQDARAQQIVNAIWSTIAPSPDALPLEDDDMILIYRVTNPEPDKPSHFVCISGILSPISTPSDENDYLNAGAKVLDVSFDEVRNRLRAQVGDTFGLV